MAPNFKKAGMIGGTFAAVIGAGALVKRYGMSGVNKLNGALSARRNAGNKPTAVQDVPRDDESGPDNRRQA